MSGAGKMGDRGGSREGKLKSLNKIKKVKYTMEKEYNKDRLFQVNQLTPKYSAMPKPMILDKETESELLYVDSLCNICSRQYAGDLNSILRRAKNQGIGAIVASVADFSHLEESFKLIEQYPGLIYAAIGVAPDVIKKNHDKLFEQRLSLISDYALKYNSVVALCSGIDFSRDVSTHAAQLKLFQSQLEIAANIKIPIIAYSRQAHEQMIEKLNAFNIEGAHTKPESKEILENLTLLNPISVAIQNFAGSDEELKEFIDLGCYIIVNGDICDVKAVAKPSEIKETSADSAEPKPNTSSDNSAQQYELQGSGLVFFRQIRAGVLPLSRLLVATEGPSHTPQNIDDIHVRNSRNEPANISFIFTMLASAYKLPQNSIVQQVLANSKQFYRLQHVSEVKTEPIQAVEPISAPVEAAESAIARSTHPEGPEMEPNPTKRGQRAAEKAKVKAEQGGKVKVTVEKDSEGELSSKTAKKKGKSQKKQQITAEDSVSEANSEEHSEGEQKTVKFTNKPAGKAKNKAKNKKKLLNSSSSEENLAQIPLPNAKKNRKYQNKGGSAENSAESAENSENSSENEDKPTKIKGKAAKKRGNQGNQKNKGKSRVSSEESSDSEGSNVDLTAKLAKLSFNKELQEAKEEKSSKNQQKKSKSGPENEGKTKGPLENEELTRFLCKNCRKVLFDSSQLTSPPTSSNNYTFSVNLATSALSVQSDIDRVDCTACSAKLGRVSEGFIVIPVSRVDIFAVAGSLSGPREMIEQYEDMEAAREERFEAEKLAAKEAEKQRKQNKKVKKQQKDDQRGNFTEFRNKSLTTKKAKDNE
jgi:Tat protein secretion system quality control protein TatD with DNase activity